MKFTFKQNKTTGPYSSFFPIEYDIKLKKKVCGFFSDDEKRIRLMVHKKDLMEDGNPNCDWKWIVLKFKGKDVQDCKDFLNANIDLILQKHNLRFEED